jgi:hypothetical protein
MQGAFIASLTATAIILAANQAFAGSRSAHNGASALTHSTAHASIARPLRHHRRNNVETFWPATDGYFYGPSNGEPAADVTPPISGEIHQTYTYDVPWDWVHRYPPAVTPSERAYVPECPTQTVTVPGTNGKAHTVNITRCY